MGPEHVTITVSIGRRIGTGADLPTAQWRAFRVQVQETFDLLDDVRVYFDGLGGGIYTDPETGSSVYEESATWVLGATVTPSTWDRVTRRLAQAAARFGQDSIAVTRGHTDLIAATAIHAGPRAA